ncbi:MAG: hypothetical protein KJO01_08355 [Gammaproteobacteria bacterium]|nr:hypothetical protein [Gammaproteobacteria bacterium]MBT8111645.1 hypothetical protein [Gammaproteobacteria bacterium]NND47821.1 hypothetical protein [Woeseiaceae bacterium]NNL46343.1 hypothetical protein [Woeseiaceae bacterium]
MTENPSIVKRGIRRELGLFVGLLFVGFVLMPVAIFWVGQSLFGAYGGQGYSDFFGTISEKIRSGDGVAWFLVLSPYLVWQCLRLTALAWRYFGRTT